MENVLNKSNTLPDKRKALITLRPKAIKRKVFKEKREPEPPQQLVEEERPQFYVPANNLNPYIKEDYEKQFRRQHTTESK